MVNNMENVVSAQKVHELLCGIVVNTDYAAMSDAELVQHRKDMLNLQRKAKEAVSKTARKEQVFHDLDIISHIDMILQRGFDLIETNPRDAPEFNDAQTLKIYKKIIKERVKVSPFGAKNFKIPILSSQRADIEKSKTLHELRQSVKAIIPVLKLYRDYEVLLADKNEFSKYSCQWVSSDEHDMVLIELEKERMISDDRKRVLDILIDGLYTPSEEMTDQQLLSAIERYKTLHQCNDEAAAKFYDISRSKITRLRRAEIKLLE